MQKLTPEEMVYELEKRRLKIGFAIFFGLLTAVLLQNLVPLTISLYRRPPDSTTAGVKESNLLMTGALLALGTSLISREATASKTIRPASARYDDPKTEPDTEVSAPIAPEENRETR